MLHNNHLKKLKHIFELEDTNVLEVLQIIKPDTSLQTVESYLSDQSADNFLSLGHEDMRAFLDGLIISSRGESEKGIPKPDGADLSNNDILKKLRIALNLLEEDIYDVFDTGNLALGPTELKGIFHKAGHKSFKPCTDQMLKSFLEGLEIMYHRETPD